MLFSSTALENKIILVTGAGKGIGRACAKLVDACGAKLIAVARTEADLISLGNECKHNIEVWVGDVSTPEIQSKITKLPQLDGLINNAGTNRVAPMVEQSPNNIEAVISLNITTAYKVAQAAALAMQASGGGSVVHMSSQMGHVGSPGRTLYCMSKHAIEGLSKAMAVELASSGVRSNTVAPTFVKTPLTEPMLSDPAFNAFVLEKLPLKQLATPEDVAHACCYLLSDAANNITGSCLKVDGGWTAH